MTPVASGERPTTRAGLDVGAFKGRALLVGSVLILISLTLTLVGNRWANYIITPVPGLYLVDALFALGAASGILDLRALRQMPRWAWLTLSMVWIYVVALIVEFAFIPENDRYNAMRDAAPFIYLSFAPFAAVALRTVSTRTLLVTVRWAGIALISIEGLTRLGILRPFATPLLGSEFTQVFASRPDLVGAALGVAIIAWGSWPAASLHSRLLVQGALLMGGVAFVSNRSGLLALIVACVIAVARVLRTSRSAVVPIAAVALLVAGLLAQGVSTSSPSPAGGPTTGPLAGPTTGPTTGPTQPTGGGLRIWWREVVEKPGTVNARIATWDAIVTGLTRARTWLVGGAAGSDYLYELCVGMPVAPSVISSGEPKCPVDDAGPEPVLRDPHNWLLNITVTHGLIGLLLFCGALAIPMWKARGRPNAAFSTAGIVVYLSAGMTFLISGGYALIPIAAFLAWHYRATMLHEWQTRTSATA